MNAHLRRRLLALAMSSSVVLLAGCPRSAPSSGKHPIARNTPQEAGPKGVNSKGITVNWKERVGQTGVRSLMDIQAETGLLDKNSQSGTLNRASGVFYREGKSKARFSAPVVEAAKDQQSVTATGGVTVVSTDPAGITLKADRVVWRVEQDKIVADGRVRFVYQPPGQTEPVGWGGPFPRAVMNTRMSTLNVETEQSVAHAP